MKEIEQVMSNLWEEINKSAPDPKHVYMSEKWAEKGGFKEGDKFRTAIVHIDNRCGDSIYMMEEEM